jgi:hypothetical protein
MAKTAAILIGVRVICLWPPECEGEGAFGLQDKHSDIHAGTPDQEGVLAFDCLLSVKGEDGIGQPDFAGNFVQGKPSARFLYLTLKGAGGAIIKRLKIHLASITWEQVRAAQTPDSAFLEARVDGRRSGSVPLLDGGWVVRS